MQAPHPGSTEAERRQLSTPIARRRLAMTPGTLLKLVRQADTDVPLKRRRREDETQVGGFVASEGFSYSVGAATRTASSAIFAVALSPEELATRMEYETSDADEEPIDDTSVSYMANVSCGEDADDEASSDADEDAFFAGHLREPSVAEEERIADEPAATPSMADEEPGYEEGTANRVEDSVDLLPSPIVHGRQASRRWVYPSPSRSSTDTRSKENRQTSKHSASKTPAIDQADVADPNAYTPDNPPPPTPLDPRLSPVNARRRSVKNSFRKAMSKSPCDEVERVSEDEEETNSPLECSPFQDEKSKDIGNHSGARTPLSGSFERIMPTPRSLRTPSLAPRSDDEQPMYIHASAARSNLRTPTSSRKRKNLSFSESSAVRFFFRSDSPMQFFREEQTRTRLPQESIKQNVPTPSVKCSQLDSSFSFASIDDGNTSTSAHAQAAQPVKADDRSPEESSIAQPQSLDLDSNFLGLVLLPFRMLLSLVLLPLLVLLFVKRKVFGLSLQQATVTTEPLRMEEQRARRRFLRARRKSGLQ